MKLKAKSIVNSSMSIMLILALCSCGSSQSNSTTAVAIESTTQDSTNIESTIDVSTSEEVADNDNMTKWEIQKEVDEFGDVKKDGSSLITSNFNGTFSNTATNDSELEVIVTCDLNKKTLYFDLKEYKDINATFSSGDMINLKYKGEDDKIHDHLLAGIAPNSSLRLDDKDEISLNIDFKRQDWESGFSDFCQKLWYGQDIKCIIEIGSSKYDFTVYGSDFNIATKELGVTFEELSKEEATLLALKCFTSGIGYELVIGNPMTVGIVNFAKHINEYDVVPVSDAENILPGRWAIYRMYNDGTGECHKYLEDGSRIYYGSIHGTDVPLRDESDAGSKWEVKDGYIYNYLKTPYSLLDLGYEGCYLLYDASENGGLDDSFVMIRLDENNKPLVDLE